LSFLDSSINHPARRFGDGFYHHETLTNMPDIDAATQAAELPQAEATMAPATDAIPADTAAPEGAPATSAPSTPSADTGEPAKKRKKTPGKSPTRGKKLKKHLSDVEKKVRAMGAVPVKAAVTELKKIRSERMALRKTKKGFDETVEIHMNLGIDSTQSDQMVRGAIGLPHGIGKSVRVLVFCQGENAAKALAAGAVLAGSTDVIEKITKENFLDFDVAIATQDMMGQVSRLGKVLGPRGLMPTPKAGTVIPANADVAAAVKEFQAGKVEYRSDKTGQIHAGVGKMSFDETKLIENISVFVEAVRGAKPSGVKGNFILGVVLSATQCPGIRVSI
jgi:large subunit ribosomal protein L1